MGSGQAKMGGRRRSMGSGSRRGAYRRLVYTDRLTGSVPALATQAGASLRTPGAFTGVERRSRSDAARLAAVHGTRAEADPAPERDHRGRRLSLRRSPASFEGCGRRKVWPPGSGKSGRCRNGSSTLGGCRVRAPHHGVGHRTPPRATTVDRQCASRATGLRAPARLARRGRAGRRQPAARNARPHEGHSFGPLRLSGFSSSASPRA